MTTDYQARKNEVLALYDATEKLLKGIEQYYQQIEGQIKLPIPIENKKELLMHISKISEKVKEDEFKIIVAGESNSGKSTFINAYLGIELLPMDVQQCTSAVVEIKYGKTFSVQATYANGRQKTITDKQAAIAFLKKNAALNDDYRDIPVPTINSEILVKSGLRARAKGIPICISEVEVEEMLKAPEVQKANIHNLPVSEYNQLIREYIKKRKNTWQDIVTKIEVIYPFEEEALKGIEIIDSPGVCARGGVSEITSDYIKDADAIIFLKSISGQALESTQFNQFMENVSIGRNKGTLFLVLTHAADLSPKDLRRLEAEAKKQFKSLDENHILIVDSKAELYANTFSHIKDIQKELLRLNNEGTLDGFLLKAYNETNGFLGSGDFVEKLKEISRFQQVDNALERFGRKAHYLLLSDLLASMVTLYEFLGSNINESIECIKSRQEAKDPKVFEAQISKLQDELGQIERKMHDGVEDVTRQFTGYNGIIKNTITKEVKDFSVAADKIAKDEDSFAKLEKLSFEKIEKFQEFTQTIQEQIVKEFDKELIQLSDKSSISFISLKPDFTADTFKKIKDSTEKNAYETRSFETGVTFKTTHTHSVYSQPKHFKLIKHDIEGRLTALKNNLSENLIAFVTNIQKKYTEELSKNARVKEKELDAIMKAKATAEQMREIIQELSNFIGSIHTTQADITKIIGGIAKYVQRKN
ncbi:hypothetical protein CJ260_11680 [Megasphaera sp. ASD88]|uniref:dynamin family protein n=1 Tax=Megasphaera sp. ASD88 TaxID=2027407 RepID=UPI000BAB6D1E|nr:dynamin family protein [Megasphaera sp. ASD88]PAV37994.1 hypothetical protein CJ260_11680 [Megasphaera sp. ASD88]